MEAEVGRLKTAQLKLLLVLWPFKMPSYNKSSEQWSPMPSPFAAAAAAGAGAAVPCLLAPFLPWLHL